MFLSLRFSNLNFVCISHLPHVRYISLQEVFTATMSVVSIVLEPRRHVFSEFRRLHVHKCIVTYRPIVRQRLGKHIPAGANARNNWTPVARQRINKHPSYNTGQYKTVFSVGSAPRLYNEKFQGSSELLSRTGFSSGNGIEGD
jgi:hypothetical protein